MVTAKTGDDSRWYSGMGIYRDVWLMVANRLHIAVDGVKITTPDIEASQAVVEIGTVVTCEGVCTRDAYVCTEILDAVGQVVARDKAPVTAFAGDSATVRQRVIVKQPKRWSVEEPYLYTCRSQIIEGEDVTDEETVVFGIRKLQLDAENGLRINGETVKLRGACIHHDNGVIGAATFARAEEKRVEIMKQAGFNAIRSAHHPMSKAMLNPCDRLGMLVMDETFDMWCAAKSPDDYAQHFLTWWIRIITIPA